MSEPVFDVAADDDLPLTVLREREAREREARERQVRERGPTLAMSARDRVGFYSLGPAPQPAGAVTASMLDASFVQLTAFFFRAALAALPAAVLVIGALWLAGHTFAVLFPGLLKLKVLLYVAQ